MSTQRVTTQHVRNAAAAYLEFLADTTGGDVSTMHVRDTCEGWQLVIGTPNAQGYAPFVTLGKTAREALGALGNMQVATHLAFWARGEAARLAEIESKREFLANSLAYSA